jgi:uncharacterized UBP type Zn finger protein
VSFKIPFVQLLQVEFRLEKIMTDTCEHLKKMKDQNPAPQSEGCAQCIAQGDTWVHLRRCLSCGNVGCCDSSKNKHASQHYRQTSHPVIQSFQQGETWQWCYVDELTFDPTESGIGYLKRESA